MAYDEWLVAHGQIRANVWPELFRGWRLVGGTDDRLVDVAARVSAWSSRPWQNFSPSPPRPHGYLTAADRSLGNGLEAALGDQSQQLQRRALRVSLSAFPLAD